MTAELVEVEDIVVVLPVSTPKARPATVTYTVREHRGDQVASDGSIVAIKFAPRTVKKPDGTEVRIAGDRVQINIVQTCLITRHVRLEPRERPSVAEVLNPEKAAEETIRAAVDKVDG